MDLKQQFLSYAEKRIADLEKGIELMEGGILQTGQQTEGGVRQNTTEETLSSYRQQLKELSDLRDRMIQQWEG